MRSIRTAAFLFLGAAAAVAETYLSPLAVVADSRGERLWVAQSTAHSLACVDLKGTGQPRSVALPVNPAGLALSPDGKQVYVTGGGAEGLVLVVNAEDGSIASKIAVGHSPIAPVVSPDGKTLYVCNQFNNNVAAIDLQSRKVAGLIPVVREPAGAALTPDGRTLFVINLLPGGAASGDYSAASISVVDAAARAKTEDLKLPNGSASLRGIAVSPDGKFVYVTHTLSRYQLPTTQLERGWMNTSALSIVDAGSKKMVNTVLLDDVDRGAANPWGVACSADGKMLLVAHAGTHEVSLIDRAALHAKLDRLAKGEKVSDVSLTADDVPNDLSFLVGMRVRVRLPGLGPRGVAAAGSKAYVAEFFSEALGVVDWSDATNIKTTSLALGPEVPMSKVRRGELLFADATMCFQHWQSCLSCHPDARVDGLNWDLLNDGMGNPKQTKSMLWSHITPPVMISGVREEAEKAVRSGMRFILFAVRPEEDSVAIDEYLKALTPVPSPHRVKETFFKGPGNASAKRGQAVFAKAGCAECHKAPLFTDLEAYDVGTSDGLEKGTTFDTPTLVECWRTAPYLCDGRAATIRDVVGKFNAEDRHGTTSKLSPGELDDLAEYVLSL